MHLQFFSGESCFWEDNEISRDFSSGGSEDDAVILDMSKT